MDLNYNIKTTAELAGAEAAADALERQIGKAKALKQDYSALDAQLKTMRGSIEEAKTALDTSARITDQTTAATKTLSTAQEAGAEHVNILHKNHRALHQILHLIARESGPAAGAVLAGAGAAAGGGIVIAVLAVKELYEWLKSLHEKAKEFHEAMERRIDLGPLVKEIGTVSTATDEAQKKTDEFFDDVNRKAGESSGWKKIADDRIAQAKRVAEEEKKLAAAEAERDKARLEYLKATKQISDEQFGQGMAAVSAMHTNKKDSADADLAQKSIAVLQNSLSNIDLDQHLIAGTLEPANLKAEEAKKVVESIKATIATNKKLLAAHREMIVGKDDSGLADQLNQIGPEEQDMAREFMSAGITNPNRDQVRAAGFQKKGAFSYTDPADVKKAMELFEKIAEERAAESSNASTISGLTGQIPEAEREAKNKAEDAKVIESKIKQLGADERTVNEELARRQSDDSITDQFSGRVAGAQTGLNAFTAQTHQNAGADLPDPRHKIEQNNKIIEALATAATQAAAEHNTSLTIITKALNDMQTANAQLRVAIDHR